MAIVPNIFLHDLKDIFPLFPNITNLVMLFTKCLGQQVDDLLQKGHLRGQRGKPISGQIQRE